MYLPRLFPMTKLRGFQIIFLACVIPRELKSLPFIFYKFFAFYVGIRNHPNYIFRMNEMPWIWFSKKFMMEPFVIYQPVKTKYLLYRILKNCQEIIFNFDVKWYHNIPSQICCWK